MTKLPSTPLFIRSQRIAFLLTFISYAFLHAARKSFTNAKNELTDHWKIQQEQLGIIDTVFMLTYATGLFAAGFAANNNNNSNNSSNSGHSPHSSKLLKSMLLIGMAGTALLIFLFGQAENFNYNHSIVLLVFLFGLNGFCQSTGWVTTVPIVSNWFNSIDHGTVFGLWASNSPVGNILGSMLVALSIALKLSIQWMFTLPAILLIIMAILNYKYLYVKPEDHPIAAIEIRNNTIQQYQNVSNNNNSNQRNSGDYESAQLITSTDNVDSASAGYTPSPTIEPLPQSLTNSRISAANDYETELTAIELNSNVNNSNNNDTSTTNNKSTTAISRFIRVLMLPGVIPYSLAFACIKCVSYSLFFWLPYYLHNGLHLDSGRSDLLSNLFDVGQIVGTFTAGYLSGRMGNRSVICVILLTLSIGCLGLYQLPTHTEGSIALIMFLTGLTAGGPSNLINSAVAADIGEATATVAGIVDGTGSLGAAIGQYIVAYISSNSGWQGVFIFLIANICLAVLILLPMCYRDSIAMYHRLKSIKPLIGIDEPLTADEEESSINNNRKQRSDSM